MGVFKNGTLPLRQRHIVVGTVLLDGTPDFNEAAAAKSPPADSSKIDVLPERVYRSEKRFNPVNIDGKRRNARFQRGRRGEITARGLDQKGDTRTASVSAAARGRSTAGNAPAQRHSEYRGGARAEPRRKPHQTVGDRESRTTNNRASRNSLNRPGGNATRAGEHDQKTGESRAPVKQPAAAQGAGKPPQASTGPVEYAAGVHGPSRNTAARIPAEHQPTSGQQRSRLHIGLGRVPRTCSAAAARHDADGRAGGLRRQEPVWPQPDRDPGTRHEYRTLTPAGRRTQSGSRQRGWQAGTTCVPTVRGRPGTALGLGAGRVRRRRRREGRPQPACDPSRYGGTPRSRPHLEVRRAADKRHQCRPHPG